MSFFQKTVKEKLRDLSENEISKISGSHDDCSLTSSFPVPQEVIAGDVPTFPEVKLDCK